MGLISAALGAASGVMADQWKEYFYCEAIDKDVLVTKGVKRAGKNSSNTKGSDNIISNGSVVAVADGQCMIIVDQGKVAEICAEPGEFVYDSSSEPSIFSGSLGQGILNTFKEIGKRFTFGGEAPKDQRVYYINTKELTGNKYGTANPVPFRIVDQNIGLDIDMGLRCFGEYSYRICDPILFYTNVCGNVDYEYNRSEIDGQLKSELLTSLQQAFSKLSDLGIRYSAIPGHTTELADALNEVLSGKWRNLRGIEIVSFGVSSLTCNEEDEAMIKELQRNAVFRNASMAGAQMVGAQSDAMKAAANNANGAAVGFMGMNMAMQTGGVNTNALFQQAATEQPQAPAPGAWTCPTCLKAVTGNFCPECGTKKPEVAPSWTCPTCGKPAMGKFCPECGTKKPEAAKCPACGTAIEGSPKFCPECGEKLN